MLVPFYEQMTQLGIDALLIYEDWIWRLEWIRRLADSILHRPVDVRNSAVLGAVE